MRDQCSINFGRNTEQENIMLSLFTDRIDCPALWQCSRHYVMKRVKLGVAVSKETGLSELSKKRGDLILINRLDLKCLSENV